MGYYSGKLMGQNAVATIPTDYILRYDFNGDVLDKSVNALNGIKTGTVNYTTGRKAGTQCLNFTNGCVETNGVLTLGVKTITISMWIKITQSSVNSVVMECSANSSVSPFRTFVIFNGLLNNKIAYRTIDNQLNENRIYNNTITPSVWQHLLITSDVSLPNTNNIYVNNSESHTQDATYNNSIMLSHLDNIIYIGQRGASSVPFVGSLQDIRIYNRVLTAEEIIALYNE